MGLWGGGWLNINGNRALDKIEYLLIISREQAGGRSGTHSLPTGSNFSLFSA